MSVNNWSVIMYPEGIIVGKVSSGKDKRSNKIRHVAKDPDGKRIGTFDNFNDAKDAIIKQYGEGID